MGTTAGNAKHIGHIGELAVALGIGLAIAAPPDVAAAAPSGGDSSTSSSSSDSDESSDTSRSDSDSSSRSRSSDGGPSDTSSSGSGSSGGSRSSGDADSSSPAGSSDGPSSDTSSGESAATGSASSDDTGDTGSPAPDPSPGSTVDGVGAPDPATPADETAPATVDESGGSTTQAGQPTADTASSGSSAPPPAAVPPVSPGPGSGLDHADMDGAGTTARITDPSPAEPSTAPSPPAEAGPAAHQPGPADPAPGKPGAAEPAALEPISNAPAAPLVKQWAPATIATTIDSTAALAQWADHELSETTHDIVRMQALSPTLPTSAAEAASQVVSNVLAAVGLRPFATDDPLAPIESPMAWALAAAWCRRQELATSAEATRNLSAAPATTSQPIETFETSQSSATFAALTADAPEATTASASSTAPTGPTVGIPDRNTGTVLGAINASGSQPGYAVTGEPSRGKATVDATGNFTYTPTHAARQTAALDPTADYDSFTVTVTDGQTSNPVTVQVPVSAARMQVAQSTKVGTTPSGAAIAGTKAYVTNQGSKSVSVLDSTNTVVATVPVGTSPTAIAANPAGTRVYVSSSGSRTVSVIDTSTNTVVATVRTGIGSTPNAVAVATTPVGTRAYVTNGGSRTVSVINTTNNTVVATVGTGTTPNAVAVNPAGTRAYVTNGGSNTVSVIDTSTNKVVGTVNLGSGTTPNAVTVSPDGARVYVANRGSNNIAVVDTATNSVVGTIGGVGTRPTSVTVTPDGTALYVASDPDTLTVIDTRTNTVVSSVGLDPTAESGAHRIALSTDGSRMLVTDAADGTVRTLALTHVNSAPTATWTVGAPRASDGAVVVTLTPADPDGDPVTFTSGPAGSGSVVADGTGAFVYTPTTAARDLAMQTPGEDADHFTISAGDGQYSTNLAVTVAISPTQPPTVVDVESTAVATGLYPREAAIVGDRLFVISEEGYLWTVDRETNAVVGEPIPAAGWAQTLTASTATNRLYVNDGYNSTIWVFDATTGEGLAGIPLQYEESEAWPVAHEMAVSGDGSRLYAASPSGVVSVIDTSTNTVLSTHRIATPSDLEISPDGATLYGTTGGTVTLTETDSMTTVGSVQVGPVWDTTATASEFSTTNQVTAGPDGTRLYVTYRVTQVATNTGGHANGEFIADTTGRQWIVTGRYGGVAVIDADPTSATFGTVLGTVRLPSSAQDVALSSDGRWAYVTGADGRTVSVLDASTLAVIGTFVTDDVGSSPSAIYTPTRQIVVDPDDPGTVYVTDFNDGVVYTVTGVPVGQSAATSV
ncbi:beta-propeller fold lactonase family protein [Rhodococcus daqingensis]|uniref:Beta-propeller fold lactonase family protein n=1 Tax=Rhodococcus daqingensis TaxID=2479363 RepID=A0ABW2RZP1_9NOCA